MAKYTLTGKLFGLHSGNGRIVWQLALDGEIPLTRLFPWRSSHDTQHAPEVLALGTAPLSTGWQTAYAIFNAHSGRVVHSGVLPGALDKVCPSRGLINNVAGADADLECGPLSRVVGVHRRKNCHICGKMQLSMFVR